MAHGYETPATFEPDDATDLKTSNGPLSVSSATVNPALSSAPILEQSFEVFNCGVGVLERQVGEVVARVGCRVGDSLVYEGERIVPPDCSCVDRLLEDAGCRRHTVQVPARFVIEPYPVKGIRRERCAVVGRTTEVPIWLNRDVLCGRQDVKRMARART